METPAVIRKGSCFCGDVKFVVTGDPLNVRACHCRDCQQLTGSAFFVRAIFPKSAVSFSGRLSEFPTNEDVVHKFCPRCGSQIFAGRRSRPDAMGIALGTFEDLKGLRPTDNIWVSDKQDWVVLGSDTKLHPQSPPP